MVKINLKNSNLGQPDKLTEYILEYAKMINLHGFLNDICK